MAFQIIKMALGYIAGFLALVSYAFYLISIFHGKTKPNRFTWAVLTLAGSITALAYFDVGARNTIWLAISYAAGPCIIFIASIFYGENRWEKYETVCLFGVFLSLIIWFLSKNPMYALAINITIDFFGLFPTIAKAYKRPWTEDGPAWLIAFLAGFINLFSLESFNLQISLYPIYIFIIDGIIFTIISFRNEKFRLID